MYSVLPGELQILHPFIYATHWSVDLYYTFIKHSYIMYYKFQTNILLHISRQTRFWFWSATVWRSRKDLCLCDLCDWWWWWWWRCRQWMRHCKQDLCPVTFAPPCRCIRLLLGRFGSVMWPSCVRQAEPAFAWWPTTVPEPGANWGWWRWGPAGTPGRRDTLVSFDRPEMKPTAFIILQSDQQYINKR